MLYLLGVQGHVIANTLEMHNCYLLQYCVSRELKAAKQ